MAFESLTDKLSSVFKKLRGRGKLSESDIKEAMREIKLALLAADVNFKIVKDFIEKISEKAMGAEVLESLTPAQQIIKIVNEELTELMGSSNSKLDFGNKPPSVIMLVGLQGAGKTTNAAKIASYFKKNHSRRPLLVACDVYRPAAIHQLTVVGGQVDVPVFTADGSKNPVDIARQAVKHAKDYGNDLVFIDTAGRLHIDDTLMDELAAIKSAVSPNEILLTVDAMTGQDAVNVAQSFNDKLDITGVILTKLDGDTRGGAAMSVLSVTGKPIKFVGNGEKLTDIEPFFPDRMASRILGMGDVLSLIDKAEQAFDEKKLHELEKKIKSKKFDLNDFLDQMGQIKKMGPLDQILGMIPGVNKNAIKDANIDASIFDRQEAIILSMTKKERAKPELLNASRRRRIAAGSGTKVEDINKLIKGFEQARDMMNRYSKGGKIKGLPF